MGLLVKGMQVNAEAIKIGKEAEEANAIASECQAGLDKALPALQAAEDALNVLTKKDMSELKVCLLTQCHPHTGCPSRLDTPDQSHCVHVAVHLGSLCTPLQGRASIALLLWPVKSAAAAAEQVCLEGKDCCRVHLAY